MRRNITHVRKDEHDNIIAVKTYEAILTTLQVVERIREKIDNFHVTAGSAEVPVGIYQDKWIRSHADGEWNNNLDNLPRF